MNLAGPPIQAGLRVTGGWHCVVGAVVSVADAEVAPTILHAVPTVWALRVHVARGGGDFKFTEKTKKPRQALTDGDIPLQTTASIATFAALRELVSTVLPSVALPALAEVALLRLQAAACVLTGLGEAGARHAGPTVLAVVAIITRGARADVAARADVVARLPVPAAPVLTRR